VRWGIVSSSELGDDWSAEAHLAYPLAVTCPACQAPTVDGRREVTWVHSSRKDLAEGWT
jgi:hypothetical protein